MLLVRKLEDRHLATLKLGACPPLQVAGLWVLLGIAVATGTLLAALPHATYAAARMWAARKARRSAAGSPGGAGTYGDSSDGAGSLHLKSSTSLKFAASSNSGSQAELLPRPISQRQLPAAMAAGAPQQAGNEPPLVDSSGNVEAAAAVLQQEEEERLEALLEAQQAVERAVGMLRRRR